MPQDWFTANAPKAKPSSGDWFAANAPKTTPPKAPPEHPHARTARIAGDLGVGAWNVLKELPAGIAAFARDLPPGLDADGTIHVPLENTLIGLAQAHANTAVGAFDAAKQGDYITAARKSMNTLIPALGPAFDASDDKIQRGQVGEGVGEIGTNIALTALGGRSAKAKAKGPVLSGPTNAKDAAAVAFAKQEGIPLDLGTATGSQTIKNVQKRVANTVAGDTPASTLQQSQTEHLTRVGQQLADQAGPTVQTPVSAGESVRAAITKGIQQDHAVADTAYGKIKALEEAQRARIAKIPASKQATMDVAQRTPLGVDVSAAVKEMQPLYNQLRREAELGIPMQGAKGRTLAALDGLMNGPSWASLSVVDAALSDLKAMARGADMPELRTTGQGSAALAVQKLDAQVRAAAAKAGPDVLKALEEGRAATRAKYVKADVLDMLSGEPGQVFRQLTANKDTAVLKLRAVQQMAPKEMANIARAYLEDMLSTATQEGGFAHTDKLWADWNKLGAESKRRLFPSKGHVEALDNFFLLAKRIKENPNPSGTAQVLTSPKLNVMEVLAYLPAKVTAKILFTPKAVNYLTQARVAAQTPSRTAQVAAMANLTRAAQSAGVSLDAIPALAGETSTARSQPSGKPR